VTFIKIRSHRRKFSNSDSVEQKKNTLNTAAKTCIIKSENQVKGKVKAKVTTTLLAIIRHNVQNVGRDS
jgi:hypothetical protein